MAACTPRHLASPAQGAHSSWRPAAGARSATLRAHSKRLTRWGPLIPFSRPLLCPQITSISIEPGVEVEVTIADV